MSIDHTDSVKIRKTRDQLRAFKNSKSIPYSYCSLSADEVKTLQDALWAARSDIWQTLRVNERNLTGIDPVFPHDEPCKPKEPVLIHRAGLDESYKVHRQICEAQKMLASKENTERTDSHGGEDGSRKEQD